MRRFVAACFGLAILLSACGDSSLDPVVQHVSMKVSDSSTVFGVSLLDHLLAEPGAGNVLVSPLSAELVLAIAASAAHGETRFAMMTTLGLDPSTDPSAELSATISRLVQSDGNVQLELAQAVWVQSGLLLDPSYVKKLRSEYRAQLANVDFQSPEAPRIVDRWVDSATHHNISELADHFDPSTVGDIVNATYFYSLWRTEFGSSDPGVFHTFGGLNPTVPMMRRTEDVTQLTTHDYVAALLPYRGGRFSALVLLPRKMLSPHDFSRFLTRGAWEQAVGYLHGATGSSLGGSCKRPDAAPAPDVGVDCEGTLVLPKFKLDYQKDMTDTLHAMGMPVPRAGAGVLQ